MVLTPESLLESPRMVGARVRRVEDPRLMTGGGSYVDDIKMVGMVHMTIVRSPYGHARIRSMDLDAARRMPGVLAVWSAEDVKHLGFLPVNAVFGMQAGRRYLLAEGKVRHVGDPVAVVVAETRYQARDAAMVVTIDYEPLPAVTDMEAALAPDAPILHEQFPNNRCYVHLHEAGDVAGAFARADRIVKIRVLQPKLLPVTMEPRATIATWEPGAQQLTVWASTQSAQGTRSALCGFFGMDENHCRVIVPDVGGGFGAKGGFYGDDALVAFAAMRTGRPVKYTEDRRDNIAQMAHGRGQINDIEAAVIGDGTLLGLRVKLYADAGAYAAGGTFTPTRTLAMGVGAYNVKNISYEINTIYTNTTPTAAFRGNGRPEAAYLLERLMDVIALDLNLDLIEVRRRNFIQPDQFPYRTPTGQTYDSGNYQGSLDLVLSEGDYEGLRRWQQEERAKGRIIGIGLSTYVEVTGGAPTAPGAARGGGETARVRVEPSGAVTVFTGASPHGQGTWTSFAQITADTLGVSMDKVKLIFGDTDKVPLGTGTFGSRVIAVGGTALVEAVRSIREKVHRIAATMLEANPDDITLDSEQGKYLVKGSPDKALTLAQIAQRAWAPWGLPRDLKPGLDEHIYWEPENWVFPFGAHLVVVEIDPDTGKTEILKFLAVDDVGKVVSPLLMEGQVHGGVATGIAAALYESVEYDDSGQLLTATLMDYATLKADDLPSIQMAHQSTPSPVNPLGAKGVGESGTIGATPAVVNAVMDALKPFGVRNLDMPLKPEKVWRALHAAPASR